MCSKIAQHLLEGIYVDQEGIQKVKNLCSKPKTRIIFLPTFKSLADPLILFYLNCFYNIELGFSFGSFDDAPQTDLVTWLAKRVGHFMMRRNDLPSNMCINYVN